MTQKKILKIVDSLAHGGAETLLMGILKNLSPVYEMHLIVLGKPHTLLPAVPEGVKLTLLDFHSYKSIPRCALFVRRYIRENRIDVVHSHLYWSNVVARIATPKKVPVFNSIHNISSQASYSINRFSLYLERLTYRRHHYILAVSKMVLDDFDKWIGLKGPSRVLYNFIEDEFFTAPAKREFNPGNIRLVAVGNLRKQKNYFYLIDEFRTMPANVSLDIYGVGPQQEALQEAITKNNLAIRLCGLHRGMPAVLRSYDAYVMCSTHEGFSLALMEAMASGLPAFLSDIPVQRESAGTKAVFFDLADPADFQRKLLGAFNTPGQLEKMSAEGIAWAESLARKDTFMGALKTLYSNG